MCIRAWMRNHEDMSSNPQHVHKEPGMAVHPVIPVLSDRERETAAFYDKDLGLHIT